MNIRNLAIMKIIKSYPNISATELNERIKILDDLLKWYSDI